FDFHSWSELSVAVHDESVGLVGRIVRVPRVVVLATFDRLPKRSVRFSRLNILLRDRHVCQYCGRRLPRSQLNLDHVIPRSRGGRTTWENIVTSCLKCNHHKGGRPPEEAGMHLVRPPFRPRAVPFFRLTGNSRLYDQWKPFMSVVDFAYWNVELEP
ncbi:MAG: HNH endonuclease, partial [Deltaproteobacteria bacterium]|nr:HNH endonuclease [Deltaproteobacteria bacterium]